MEEKKIPLNMKEKEYINDINDDTKKEIEKKQQIININIYNNSTISSSCNSMCDESTSEIGLCESPFIYQKEKFLVDKEKREIISLYSTFKYLKEKYGIENSRKNRMDCMIKKIKTKYINAIHEAIKYCVNININKLPQYFVTNIKIEYNKMYLNKTVEQIYKEFNILPSLNELINKNLIKKNKKELLIELMNSSLKDIYQYYLTSDLYKYHRLYIIKKEGENIGKLYDYVAINICKYFLYNKGNKKLTNYNNNNNSNVNKTNNNKMYEKKIIDKDYINDKNVFYNNFKSTYDKKNNNSVSIYNNKIKFIVK
jgi:hypothetical protein